MTDKWVQLNMITGEIKPLDDEQDKQRRHRSDAGFTAIVELCGYKGQVLTDSLRGALNKAYSQIKWAEREKDAEITLEDLSALIKDFAAWFKTYRRERFNEVCQRAPYPMETAKLWPEYRKSDRKKSSWPSYAEQLANPRSAAYRLAHRHDNEGEAQS